MREQNGSAPYARGMAELTRAIGLVRHGGAPRLLIDTARSVRRRARTIRRVDDLPGRVRMLRMVADSALGRETDRPAASTAVPVVARGISERPVWLRPRSRDHAAFAFLDGRHHLPPPELVDEPRHIAVLGAGIGLPLAELAALHPQARLLGVEPDADDAAVARRNLAHLGERCRLVEKAVWWRDEDGAVDATVLLDRFTGGAPLDYLLANIGSAPFEMLRHGDWTRNVRCIKIEIRAQYEEALPLLRALGFRARLERLAWGAFAVGIRP